MAAELKTHVHRTHEKIYQKVYYIGQDGVPFSGDVRYFLIKVFKNFTRKCRDRICVGIYVNIFSMRIVCENNVFFFIFYTSFVTDDIGLADPDE